MATASRYDQVTAGFKANLSDVLAAIALVQLEKLEAHAEIRARQFGLYDEGLADLDGITPLARDPRDTHALHLYVVRIDPERAGATRDDYQRALAEERIATSIHFLPVHRLTWFRERYPDAAAASGRRAGGRGGALAAALAGPLRRRHRGRDRRPPPRPRPLRAHEALASGSALTVLMTGLALALPRLEGRHPRDGRHAARRRSLVVRARRGDHDRHRASDGAPLAVAACAAQRMEERFCVADPRLLRLVRRKPGAAHVDRRRRDARLRDGAAAPGRDGDVTAIILLERGLGGAGTVLLGAIGFLLALGTYDVSAYLWLEGAFVLGTIVLMFLFFARSARPLLARTSRSCALPRRPPAPRVLRGRPSLPRPRPPAGRGVRLHDGDPGGARPLDLGGGEGRRDRPRARIYYVMGPLFFLVLLVPFTLNGIAVREAFFVSFLGSVGVRRRPAFASGFLFFLVDGALAVPGGVSCSRGPRRRSRPAGASLTSAACVVVTHDASPWIEKRL